MKICPKCGSLHDKKGTFCSYRCSNSKTFSIESRQKTSNSTKKYHENLSDANKIIRDAKVFRPDQTLEARLKISNSLKKYFVENGTRSPTPDHAIKFSSAGNSVHRKIECIAKPYIEEYFSTSNLNSSKVGDHHWFDFVNDKYIIEYTIDHTSGISDAIIRFESIVDDKRMKYLVGPSYKFGPKRRERLLKTGAIFVPIWFDYKV
jgi:hypothetical protein